MVGAALAMCGCATTRDPLPVPPTIEEVVSLSQARTPPDAIIARMHAARAVYPQTATELARLRERGVADAVVDYMQRTQIEAARYAGPMIYRYPEWSRTSGYSNAPWSPFYRP
jgi:hypothetical protein